MEMLAEALGARNVDFEQRLACCGFHAIYPAECEALASNGVSCLTARAAGADCLVTPCPLCHMAIDMWQADSQKRFDADITMPVCTCLSSWGWRSASRRRRWPSTATW